MLVVPDVGLDEVELEGVEEVDVILDEVLDMVLEVVGQVY